MKQPVGRPRKDGAVKAGQPPVGYSYMNILIRDDIRAAIKKLSNKLKTSYKDFIQEILLSDPLLSQEASNNKKVTQTVANTRDEKKLLDYLQNKNLGR